LKPGDEVIVENPGYAPMKNIPEMIGAKVKLLERRFENNFQIDVEECKKLISNKTKLIIITNLHNPSGVLLKQSVIEELSVLANEKGILLLIDEIFLAGANISTKSSAMLPNVIITSSLTKVFGLGGLRTGWIIAHKSVAEKCQKMKSYISAAAPYLSEHIAAYLISNEYENLIRRFQSVSQSGLALVDNFINGCKQLEYHKPDGGIICFVKYCNPNSSVNLCKDLLLKKNVLVNPGVYFGCDGFFRLTFSNDIETLRAGLNFTSDYLTNTHV
jgi:aspartate/methionine/tyrosine aminotransferase